MDGCLAFDIWYDDYHPSMKWVFNMEVHHSEEKQKKRRKFLSSLAKYMSMLRHIEFPKIGMLTLDENRKPIIGPRVSIDPNTNKTTVRTAYTETRKFYKNGIIANPPRDPCPVASEGLVKLYEYILSSQPFSPSNPEKEEQFVLAHIDLNLQNILCDPNTGEVTAILDWEGAHFVPRAVGYASVPLFLREDWRWDYDTLNSRRQLPEDLWEYYRRFYADEMKGAMEGHPDAAFTFKSAAYTAFHTAVYPDPHYYNGGKDIIREKILDKALSNEPASNDLVALGEGQEHDRLCRRVRWKVQKLLKSE
jgi:hypothetical protein